MNQNLIKSATISLAFCGLTAAANADIIMGEPVTSPVGLSTASIEFRGASASYTGELYFMGWGSEESILHFAPDSNHSHLGQWLFNNHESTPGSQMALLGEFDSGSVLHFAYKIISPRDQRDLFRTDVLNDRDNFAYDPANGDLRIEDLRRNGGHDGDDDDHHEDHFRDEHDGGDCLPYDGDFNDAMFTVTFQSIPAPGSLALLGLGGLAMTRRRRR